MSHFGRAGPPDIRDTHSLLVLNITFRTTADELFPLFDRYGKVVDIFIPRDRRTGESRGFAFVRYKHVDEAQKAIDRLDGKNLNGRNIMVQFAKYDRKSEKTACGRITTLTSRSRSRSPRRTRRSRDDRDRDRDYREHRHRSRSRDRYERDRSRDGYDRGRSRERYDHDRSKDRYERERNNISEREHFRRRSPSRSRSRGRYADEAHHAIRDGSAGRNLSPAPVSPARVQSSTPVRDEVPRGSQSPGPVAEQATAFQERTRRSGTPEQRSPSPVRQSLSPDAKGTSMEKPSASPGPRSPSPINMSPDVQSPYNTDPDES